MTVNSITYIGVHELSVSTEAIAMWYTTSLFRNLSDSIGIIINI